MLKAVTRQAAKVDARIKQLNTDAEDIATAEGKRQPTAISTAYFFDHHATPEDIAVMVTEADFMDAHKELIPSVSAGELAHYERVRASFEGGREGSQKTKPAPPLSQGQRTVSGTSAPGKLSAKGKGKAVMGKGKGKAVATGSDDEYEDDYGIEADDGGINGASRDKGKGKAVAGFQSGTASDDEGLYDD